MLKVLIACLVALTFSFGVVAATPDRLLLATQKWAPYQTYANNTIAGLGVSRIQCVMRKMRQPYQLTMTDWRKAQVYVQSGQHHGLFLAEQSPENDKYATFSEPLMTHQWYWYFSNAADKDIIESDKKSWKVTTKFGTSKWFYLHNQGFNVVKKPRTMANLLDMLLHNEVDAVLVDGAAMQVELNRQGLSSQGFNRKLVSSRPLGVYFENRFLQRYPNFLAEFNDAATQCVEIE